jgi:hypothetical protein
MAELPKPVVTFRWLGFPDQRRCSLVGLCFFVGYFLVGAGRTPGARTITKRVRELRVDVNILAELTEAVWMRSTKRAMCHEGDGNDAEMWHLTPGQKG